MSNQMKYLSGSEKRRMLGITISSLLDEFVELHNGRFPVLDELPDFVNTLQERNEKVLAIVHKRNELRQAVIADSLARYPNFVIDLEKALELLRKPRNDRPDPEVT